LKIIFIKETKNKCDFIKRSWFKIEKILNIIKTETINNSIVYSLPILRTSKISQYRIKKLSDKINKLLEKDGANTIVLSEGLYKNELLKNYLYSFNINILDGRYLFKCLTYETLEYIFKIKNKKIELRRSFNSN